MKIGTFTNDAYDVFGIMIGKTLYGWITKSLYPSVYHKGQYVEFPKYHLPEDTIPQFKIKIRSMTPFPNFKKFTLMKEDSHSITSDRTTNKDNKQEGRIDLEKILRQSFNLPDDSEITRASVHGLGLTDVISAMKQAVKESIPMILEMAAGEASNFEDHDAILSLEKVITEKLGLL